MDTKVGWTARAETTLARRQLKRLKGMHVNLELAKSVMEMTGAILVVPIFRCYRANRQKFGGREQFEVRITILHLDGVTRARQFIRRMTFMGMVPIDFEYCLRDVTVDDCRRVLSALQFLAQRY